MILHEKYEVRSLTPSLGGASGRYSYLDKVALQYAFVVQAVGKETP